MVEDASEKAMARCLVVLIPGIGGSVLESADARVLWDTSFKSLGGLLVRPSRLEMDRPVLPVGLINTATLFPGLAVIHGYSDCLEALGAALDSEVDHGDPRSPRLDARVVAFPYDFRRSIAQSAAQLHEFVDTRLRHLNWSKRTNSVIIVAHSMGGLVARYWVGMGNFERCRAVVTLATPHRGAPKALEYLVNGPLPWLVGSDRVRELFRTWPSMFELMPRYRSVLDLRSEEPANGSDRSGGLYPAELGIDWLTEPAAAAFRVHEDIERAWSTHVSTECFPLLGGAHKTLLSATWDGRSLVSSHAWPVWLLPRPPGEWHGDGTVPAVSARPIEQAADLTRPMLYEFGHGAIVSARQVTRFVADLIANRPPSDEHVRSESQLTIGLDMEDAYPSDRTIEIRARVDPSFDVPVDMMLRYAVRHESGWVGTGSFRRDDGVWSALLPKLRRGAYRVEVSATRSRNKLASASAWVLVVEEDPTSMWEGQDDNVNR